MIEAAPSPPLHERIRRDIEARIMAGAWMPGDRIPYEHQLMSDYQCSRMTVNKALSGLVQAGLIERRKRAGTFVTKPRFQRAALEIPDIRSEVASQGQVYSLELRSRAVRQADAQDRSLLGIAGGRILALETLHFANARPYALEHRLINLDAVPAAENADFAADPAGSWLLAHVPWTEAEHRISAVPADERLRADLALEAGAACLSLERWTWRGDERITYARLVYPGERYSLVAHFRAQQSG